MESCRCPMTHEIFEDPVMGNDGHTYERKAITEWLTRDGTSPITAQPMNVKSLRTNFIVKKMIEELKSITQSRHVQYQFELDVDIRKTKKRPLVQVFGKSIYEVEWINRDGPSVVLLKIDGAKANREALFYVQLSCHPHVVRTFGLVQSNASSVMLLQEFAEHGDLSELLRENEFKPTERVLSAIFEQICDAMICLADNGIVHGDLACRNILVFKFNPTNPKKNLMKLTDFGLTRASSLYSVVNTPAKTIMNIIPVRYGAPELLQNTNKLNYSEKSDVYSFGVLMWEACSYGALPYLHLEDDDDVRREKLNNERLSRPPSCSDQLWVIMNKCWQQDPADRPDFRSLKQHILSFNYQTDSKEAQRIAIRARSISQEPVTEQLPCEYCEQLYSAKQLHAHQIKCLNNPQNVESATRIARPRLSQSASPLTRSKNSGSRSASAHDLSRGHDCNVHYQIIDRGRTRAANRSDDNDRPIDPRNSNRIPVRLASDGMAGQSDYPQGIRTYDNEPRRSNEHRSDENISRSNRPRSTDRIRPRERSSLDNLRNIEDIEDPNGRATCNRSPYYQDARGSRRNRSENGTVEVIDNHPDRPLIKKHKEPWWKKIFECSSSSRRYDNW